MDSQLSELRNYVVDLRSRVGEHISGVHANKFLQVDQKLGEILALLQDTNQLDNAATEKFANNREPQKIQDDLTRIQGITVELKRSLHALNIHRFQTIADWTSKDVQRIGTALAVGFQIQKQNWMEQAKILASGGSTLYSRRSEQGYKLATRLPDALKSLRKEYPAPPVKQQSGLIASLGDTLTITSDEPQISQDLESLEVAPDELSKTDTGRDHNFFRLSGSQPESVQNSEKPEKTGDQAEKKTVSTYKNESKAVDNEGQQYSSGEIQANADFSPTKKDSIPTKTDKPVSKKIDLTHETRVSFRRKRTTFPDFKLFTDTSFPAESKTDCNDSEAGTPNQSSLTNDDRGVMRRFFRAITKPDKQ